VELATVTLTHRDPTSEAVQIARALDWKYPIKVQSLREEEFKVGRYRAMAVHRVRAATDAQPLFLELLSSMDKQGLPAVRAPAKVGFRKN